MALHFKAVLAVFLQLLKTLRQSARKEGLWHYRQGNLNIVVVTKNPWIAEVALENQVFSVLILYKTPVSQRMSFVQPTQLSIPRF